MHSAWWGVEKEGEKWKSVQVPYDLNSGNNNKNIYSLCCVLVHQMLSKVSSSTSFVISAKQPSGQCFHSLFIP